MLCISDRGFGIEYRTSELFLKDCCQFQISNALASDFSEFKENVTNLISDLGSPSVTFCPFCQTCLMSNLQTLMCSMTLTMFDRK